MAIYKIYAGDPDFKKAFEESIIRILALHEKSNPAQRFASGQVAEMR